MVSNSISSLPRVTRKRPPTRRPFHSNLAMRYPQAWLQGRVGGFGELTGVVGVVRAFVAKSAAIAITTPSIMLFQNGTAATAPSTNAERISQQPRITFSSETERLCGFRLSASSATEMPTATSFHMSACAFAKPSTNGEIITQMPNTTFTQFAPITCPLSNAVFVFIINLSSTASDRKAPPSTGVNSSSKRATIF